MATRGKPIARYLSIRCQQGSADAFVQNSAATGIIPEEGVGLKVNAMEVCVSVLSGIAADGDIQWSVTRDSKAAITGYADNDSILYDGWWFASTTSGTYLVPVRVPYTFPDGVYLVEPTLYLQLDSTATGVANILDLRVYYEEVALSEVDILRVLNNA